MVRLTLIHTFQPGSGSPYTSSPLSSLLYGQRTAQGNSVRLFFSLCTFTIDRFGETFLVLKTSPCLTCIMSESPKERIPEEDDTTEAPLSMAASVVLSNLPKDASKALETAGNLSVQKGTAPARCRLLCALPFQCRPVSLAQHADPPKAVHLTKFWSAVTIRLQPIGSAPHLTQRIFKLSTNQNFATIVR